MSDLFLASLLDDPLHFLLEPLLGLGSTLHGVNGLGLGETTSLALVKERAIAFVLLPFFPEHIDKGFLLIEGRLVLEDRKILVLVQAHVRR